jgi:fructose-specific phosphotransferase system IIC component
MAVLFLIVLSISVMWITVVIVHQMWRVFKYVLEILLSVALGIGIFFLIMYTVNTHANEKTQEELQDILNTFRNITSQFAPDIMSPTMSSLTSLFNRVGMLR